MTRRRVGWMAMVVVAICVGGLGWWLGRDRASQMRRGPVQAGETASCRRQQEGAKAKMLSGTPGSGTRHGASARTPGMTASASAVQVDRGSGDRPEAQSRRRRSGTGAVRLTDLAGAQRQWRSSSGSRVVPDWREFRKKHPTTQGLRVFADRPHRPYPRRGSPVR